MSGELGFGPADVLRARAILRPYLAPTPLRPCVSAGRDDVLLKLECWQPTGSFKVRGAMNVVHSLSDGEKARGLVAASAGNHALGVAHAVATLAPRTQATLFVPTTAPKTKITRLRSYPVRVELYGETYEEAQEKALGHAAATGAVFVHAFADPRTAAGQGTVAFEVLEERPDVATLVVPVGGGGLIMGIAVAAKAVAPRVRIVAVQPAASPALRDSIIAGRPLLEYASAPTLADGIAGGIGEMAFANRHLIDEVVVVEEADIEAAVVALVTEDHVVAEGSAAVAVAAVCRGQVSGPGPIAVVVTGANIDGDVLARLLASHA